MIKLDLGAGAVSPEGFMPLGYAHGTQIYPLPSISDNSCAVVRASHVLEHFKRSEIAAVVKEWVRVLAPGGELKIAVPDFEKTARNYLAGVNQPTEGYVMGGQVDGADHHKAIFDTESLTRTLAGAGLMLVRRWESEIPGDCAALDISLNLSATKPHMNEIGVSAAMSVPRLGFMDNMFCAQEALPALRIKLRRYSGAYWGQCIERVFEESLKEDAPEAVLAIDYDSVYSKRDVGMLMQLMCCHPEADAICAVQAGRGKELPLFTMRGEDGSNSGATPMSTFTPDLTKITTAHFGLTLIRANKLRDLPKPWFHDVPADDGTWGDGRTDADVAFWHKWEAAGNSLYLANRVPIGHLELQVMWPGADAKAIYQPVGDWRANGKPKDAWK
jgi:hypothetical protein